MTKGWPYRVISLIITLFILSSYVSAATLLELDAKLRYRVNEVDTATSLFDTTTSFQWLNMAQDRIAVLAGYFPKFVDFIYKPAGDTAFFELPADFRAVKKALVYSQGRFYPMYLNPGLAKDTGLMTYDILWKDEDNAHFVYTLGGFQAAQTDIIFSSDSSTYRLPADVKNITGILVGDGTTWEPAVPNPMFAKDLGPRQFDVHFKARDTALLYLRGTFQDDDTVRVFYQKTLQANDTIRVEYVGIPTDMALSSTDCAVPDDLEEFLVEEAIGYYFTYKNDEVKAQAWWQKVRLDMGVLEPPKK